MTLMEQSEMRPRFVDLNLLPEELRARRYRVPVVLGVAALLAAALLLIPLYYAERAAEDETARLQTELEIMSDNLALVRVDLGEIRNAQQQIDTAEAGLASLNEQRQAILGDGQELSRELSVAVLDPPPGVSLGTVTGGDAQMTLTGQARNWEDIFEYAETLEKSGGFSEARVVSLATQGGEAVTFAIVAVR